MISRWLNEAGQQDSLFTTPGDSMDMEKPDESNAECSPVVAGLRKLAQALDSGTPPPSESLHALHEAIRLLGDSDEDEQDEQDETEQVEESRRLHESSRLPQTAQEQARRLFGNQTTLGAREQARRLFSRNLP
jgi:hypothetical protein